MSEEELTSKMEFIVDQQAQFAAKFGQLEDIVVRLANASLKRFEDLEDTTEEKLRDVNDRIAALVDSQMKLTEAQSRTDESRRNLMRWQTVISAKVGMVRAKPVRLSPFPTRMA